MNKLRLSVLIHGRNVSRLFILCTLLLSVAAWPAFAQRNVEGRMAHSPNEKIAEGCFASSAYADLDINNVRARINAGGDIWWNLFGKGQYYIPKNSNKTSLFSGALWIGGLDDMGAIHLAMQQYRGEGVDFFPGPLSADGLATTDPVGCQSWDRIFTFYKNDVEDFIAAYRLDPSLSNYDVPDFIKNYPAHGDLSRNQSYYLAPFFDYNGDGAYNYTDGDYPYYDFDQHLCFGGLYGMPVYTTMEGNGIMADQALKGDQTLWWVFNDKGNIHTESEGLPIGVEVRAQAFAFATNDEINNTTYYSFEIINRSSDRLNDAWIGWFTDVELGNPYDDYVGCDVYRGLGYCYNGVDPDGFGGPGDYGAQPPAVGVDILQGPYMDADGMDNPRYTLAGDLICGPGISGANFGDGIMDNERYGMSKFFNYNVPSIWWPTPSGPEAYYNILRGLWPNGDALTYWGNAHVNAGGYGPPCSFMFPWDSDPCNYGTNSIDPGAPYPAEYWTESQAGNDPYDRRMFQSSGPFTMEPGAVNYFTIGVPWARAVSGGPLASLEQLKVVDDKCQRLFDNCFRTLQGPDAPDLSIQELDKELILYLSNRKYMSNNYSNTPEDYSELDPNIVFPDSLPGASRGDSLYRFEGYQIFQLKDATVSIEDLRDADKARLVAQCDLKNGISKIVNFYYDADLNGSIPVEEVYGADQGIVHSFRLFEDAFASGDKRLVNHKQYYFLAVAYAYNNFERYDPMDPLALTGQKMPYLSGRRGALGSILPVTGIPHIPSPEAGGTITHSEYGVQPMITRIEGQGNGGMAIDLTPESQAEILANGRAGVVEYQFNRGPVNVKVVDPLNVKAANYTLRFISPISGNIDSCNWVLTNEDNGQQWTSESTIKAGFEQLIQDIGLSVHIFQVPSPGYNLAANNGFLEGKIEFADSTKQWLTGIPDYDAYQPFNWIRAGMYTDAINNIYDDFDPVTSGSPKWLDPSEAYEKILGGTWAPYALASYIEYGPAYKVMPIISSKAAMMANIASVDLFITSDMSKWSRCPVFELGEDPVLAEGNVAKMDLRYGSTDGEQGMGWFPGYAVNVETGERLNIAFGEDTWMAHDNGKDMIWNPTSTILSDFGDPVFAGKHWLYIFGHNRDSVTSIYGRIDCPTYDGGAWIKEAMEKPDYHDRQKSFVFKDVMWVGAPATTFDTYWEPSQIPCDVKISIRVGKPYKRFYSSKYYGADNPQNSNYPLYSFNTEDIAVTRASAMAAEGSLALINAVPNPYFAYSSYENTQQDHVVKITNLPQQCQITIYNIQGTLVRDIRKDDALPFYEWDITNNAGNPVAGGIYLIYVRVEGVGEKLIKWFGATRPSGVNPF